MRPKFTYLCITVLTFILNLNFLKLQRIKDTEVYKNPIITKLGLKGKFAVMTN